MATTTDTLYQLAVRLEAERDAWREQAQLGARWLTAAVYCLAGAPYEVTPSDKDWEQIEGKSVEIVEGTLRIT